MNVDQIQPILFSLETFIQVLDRTQVAEGGGGKAFWRRGHMGRCMAG